MSNRLECISFSVNALSDIFNWLDATDTDRRVANDMIQDLMKDLEKQFKIDYQKVY